MNKLTIINLLCGLKPTQLVMLDGDPETFSAVKELEKENFLRYCGREYNGIMVLPNRKDY